MRRRWRDLKHCSRSNPQAGATGHAAAGEPPAKLCCSPHLMKGTDGHISLPSSGHPEGRIAPSASASDPLLPSTIGGATRSLWLLAGKPNYIMFCEIANLLHAESNFFQNFPSMLAQERRRSSYAGGSF